MRQPGFPFPPLPSSSRCPDVPVRSNPLRQAVAARSRSRPCATDRGPLGIDLALPIVVRRGDQPCTRPRAQRSNGDDRPSPKQHLAARCWRSFAIPVRALPSRYDAYAVEMRGGPHGCLAGLRNSSYRIAAGIMASGRRLDRLISSSTARPHRYPLARNRWPCRPQLQADPARSPSPGLSRRFLTCSMGLCAGRSSLEVLA